MTWHLLRMLQAFSILHVVDESKSWAMSIENAALSDWLVGEFDSDAGASSSCFKSSTQYGEDIDCHIYKINYPTIMHVRQVKNTWGMKNPRWFLKYNRLDPLHLEIDFSEVTPTCTYFCFSPPYCRFYRRSQL